MSTLVIQGGRRLQGRIDVEGNKNAALPLIAACLLTDQPCVLTNVPRIADVEVMARLLLDLGAEVNGIGSTTLRIQCREVSKHEPDSALVGRLRGSVLLLGPLLARLGKAYVAPPGGDFPARRSIRTHIDALTSMRPARHPRAHQLHGFDPLAVHHNPLDNSRTSSSSWPSSAGSIAFCDCYPPALQTTSFISTRIRGTAWTPWRRSNRRASV